MRVAFISFEFPPSVAVGGIGSYSAEATRMLADVGCEVEVFAAGYQAHSGYEANGILVHRIPTDDRSEFREALASVFTARQLSKPFDVMESPEFGAEGTCVWKEFPTIARVVKLHTPTFMVHESSYEPPTLIEQARFSLGALRRGRWAKLSGTDYRRENDAEYWFTQNAHEIVAPCQAIADRVSSAWSLDTSKLTIFPHPYSPTGAALSLLPSTSPTTIGFLGRLEPRKGVLELAEAIPWILLSVPNIKFRLIGPSWPYKHTDMQKWITRKYSGSSHAITFVGEVSREHLFNEIGHCDFMVLPSRWENFPMACIESMAAGRPVIGSSSGGMAELIRHGQDGMLISPRSPDTIAEAVLSIVKHPEDLARLGTNARKRILEWLPPSRIAPLHIASYQRAIDRARQC